MDWLLLGLLGDASALSEGLGAAGPGRPQQGGLRFYVVKVASSGHLMCSAAALKRIPAEVIAAIAHSNPNHPPTFCFQSTTGD